MGNTKIILPSIEILQNSGAIFYDCDGVLTDNRVLVSEDGKESVFFNRSDGLAISCFRQLGIHQAIVSSESNPVIARRAEKLHIPVIHKLDSKNLDKGSVLKSYCLEYGISLESSIFIGNDINDLSALKTVGYPVCPVDAEEEIKMICVWISQKRGGYGVARDLYNFVVEIQSNTNLVQTL